MLVIIDICPNKVDLNICFIVDKRFCIQVYEFLVVSHASLNNFVHCIVGRGFVSKYCHIDSNHGHNRHKTLDYFNMHNVHIQIVFFAILHVFL